MSSLDPYAKFPVEERPGDEFSISLSFDDGLYVIEPYGDLDLATAAELDDAIRQAESTAARQITVDLSGLSFADSSGIHVLLSATARASGNGDRLRFLRGSGQVERVLAIAGVERRLPFAD